MGKFNGRKPVACTACHSQKLKCSGETPCDRCVQRNRECVYPKKEKYITVPESYLREIEGEASVSRQTSLPDRQATSPQGETSHFSPASDSLAGASHLRQDCAAEHFIQKLKDLSVLLHPFVQSGDCQPLETSKDKDNVYFRLKSDLGQPELLAKLPSRQNAIDLLNIFEEEFCDYHWFLRKDFRERLYRTYSDPTSQSGDRNWFCRVSAVLALAQSSEDDPTPDSQEAESSTNSTLPSPGSGLFEQAVRLFRISEEPTLGDMEASNLMVICYPGGLPLLYMTDQKFYPIQAFYCYSLDRPKTALIYTSQSLTLAKLLHLDKAKPHQPKELENETSNHHRVLDEHMRRLLWTSLCLDNMVAEELDMSSTQQEVPKDVPLPSSSHLPPEDIDQFFDPATFLENIESEVGDTVSQ
ncbi:hypothetical protein FSARC_6763 [Fusarium sarcochroum]|uniref:Zn(2)-C6 fungal-type domain-containing protein n=1 Tax=Fusarium sarcochroum TaxID=1208366 RepID=A0A8H4X919_9HYPO|nr:hypothetical protein FSARC_6763 [Fusarium sarcochroum]